MKLLKKVPAVFISIISILFLSIFIPQDIAAQSPTTKNTAIGCPYDYTKSLPGYQYESRDAELINRAMSLSAIEIAQKYRVAEISKYLDFSQKVNTKACWDSLFLHANPDIKPDIAAIRIGIDGTTAFYAVEKYQLEDSLATLRVALESYKRQIDTTITLYREEAALEELAKKIEEETDSLKRHNDSLHNDLSSIIYGVKAVNATIDTVKRMVFGEFLTTDTAAWEIYESILDTCKKLLELKALPESARLIFVSLNKDSVNNREIFDRLVTKFWAYINNDVTGMCETFFPSLNNLEIDLECLNTLIAVGRHTEDSTTSEILPLITAFWECYWAGEEQHLEEFTVDPDINVHDRPGGVNIEELAELRVKLIEKEVLQDTISLAEFQTLTLLDDIYRMNQEGRLSQNAANVAQELLLQPLKIIEIRERFWSVVKNDFTGMKQVFQKYVQDRQIKKPCAITIEEIKKLSSDTQRLNDLITEFWECQKQ